MSHFYCGLDFGTSNSVLSIAGRAQSPHLITLEQGMETIPSAVFYPTQGGETLYGRRAALAYKSGEEGRFMRSLKRALGTSLMNEGTLIGTRRVPFHEIITFFIRHIKEAAESAQGESLSHVVAGRPVHFVDGDPDRDIIAQTQLQMILQNAGFRHILFQYEPIAAAFAHEVHLPAREHKAIVVDIGGGTSDFSVLKLSGAYTSKMDRSEDILGNTGLRLGGNDFDRTLSLKKFMPLLGMGTPWGPRGLTFPAYPFFDLSEWGKIPFMYAPRYKRDLHNLARDAKESDKISRLTNIIDHEKGHSILGSVEETKIALSDEKSYCADLSFVETGLTAKVTQDELEEALQESCNKIKQGMQECLVQGGLSGDQIDLVILTGGGTGIPAVQQVAQHLCPQANLSAENMLASVGLGLAYDAARRFI